MFILFSSRDLEKKGDLRGLYTVTPHIGESSIIKIIIIIIISKNS